MNAPEIAGPSVSGGARFASTWMRPMTVPMMPMVGEKPPASLKTLALAEWRPAMASVSISRTSATTSASVPSTTSCRPFLVNSSSILPISSSSASRPSRRARSARATRSSGGSLGAGARGEGDEQLGALVEVGRGARHRLLVQRGDGLHPLEAGGGHHRADGARHDDDERGHVEEGGQLAALHGRAEGEPDERDDDSDGGGGLHVVG